MISALVFMISALGFVVSALGFMVFVLGFVVSVLLGAGLRRFGAWGHAGTHARRPQKEPLEPKCAKVAEFSLLEQVFAILVEVFFFRKSGIIPLPRMFEAWFAKCEA